MFETTMRQGTLDNLVTMLREQNGVKRDLVVPATSVQAKDGGIVVTGGGEPEITLDGVTTGDLTLAPTAVMIEQIAGRLNVPVGYLKRIREERTDLFDTIVNETVLPTDSRYSADGRRFTVRTFAEGGSGIGRALLSDRYSIIDNFDVLVAVLDGVRQTGTEISVGRCDLTDRSMFVQIAAPAISAYAPELLKGYRSPFTGATGEDNPTVFAGFRVGNSEVGGGAFSITPQIIVKICNNGMTITKDAMRAVHLGSRQEEGLVRWSEDTQGKALSLITARARDSVATFLDVDYVTRAVATLEAKAGKPVAKADVVTTVVSKGLGFSQEHADGVLNMFVQGGQMTAGGIVQAITAYSQTVADADTAHAMDDAALRVLSLV